MKKRTEVYEYICGNKACPKKGAVQISDRDNRKFCSRECSKQASREARKCPQCHNDGVVEHIFDDKISTVRCPNHWHR